MVRQIEIVVAEDPAAQVAGRLAEAARTGGHVVLTGGSSPRIAYELAAGLERDRTAVELWWGAARWGPPEGEPADDRMAKQALPGHRCLRPVHRMAAQTAR